MSTRNDYADAHWRVPGERYCLVCEKLGHRTYECHSTHALISPAAREIGLMAMESHRQGSATTGGSGSDVVQEPVGELVASVRSLVLAARTAGGTAGRDDGLCAALDRVEDLLAAQDSPAPNDDALDKLHGELYLAQRIDDPDKKAGVIGRARLILSRYRASRAAAPVVAVADGDTLLCQAWGETDLPAAHDGRGLDGVRRFLVDQWLGSEDKQADDGTLMLPDAIADMQDEWRREGEAWEWTATFEIGGVSVQKVADFTPAAPAVEPAVQLGAGEREPWLLYLSDRADGVKGHYAIARWNPAGYREVWNLRSHGWNAFSDDVLTLDEANKLLEQVAIPTDRAARGAAPVVLATFQQRVRPWMLACFGAEISADGTERNHRLLEEALETVQSTGCTQSEAHQLVDYVFGRPVGEPAQEVGGVMVTLAALCLAHGLDMHAAGEVELARIWTKVDAIRAKQAAKPKHSPLPIAVGQSAAVEAAPVAFSLQWPEDVERNRINISLTFDTEAEARDYAEGCGEPRQIRVVALHMAKDAT